MSREDRWQCVTELLSNNGENKSTAQGIEFVASIGRISTREDMGIQVVFQLPEDAIIEAAWLLTAKREGCAVHCKLLAV